MLFSSGIFWAFYSIVIILLQINYRMIGSVKYQNLLLLVASYFFYGYWDLRFLGLIIVVSAQTYICAYCINNHKATRTLSLGISIFINLAILFYFKYLGFFASELITAFNISPSYSLENIILPVGISFYIFQSFTYVLDVYSGKLAPEKDPIRYFAFISFFPQLVAGPIERASSLLPQFQDLKGIDLQNLYDGIKIIIIGLFLKVFIADSIAPSVDFIFTHYQTYNGGTLLLGAIGFSIQIYGDFAGYSLIAIGVAKVIGFSLIRNFDTPYFSTSIQEFWRRWHISLSSFFRDYVYIPLGGSYKSDIQTHKNLLITFTISGLWHGANWTFILWGVVHGILLIIQRIVPFSLTRFMGWFATMLSVLLLWILFRSESVTDFFNYISIIISNPGIPEYGKTMVIFLFYYFIVDLIIFRYSEKGGTWFSSVFLETASLMIMLFLVLGTMHPFNQNFIYFQF